MVPFTSQYANSGTYSNNSTDSDDSARQPDTPSERLADLVHHLCEVPMSDARRAIHHNAHAGKTSDPLAVVAGAVVQLKNERRAPRHPASMSDRAPAGPGDGVWPTMW